MTAVSSSLQYIEFFFFFNKKKTKKLSYHCIIHSNCDYTIFMAFFQKNIPENHPVFYKVKGQYWVTVSWSYSVATLVEG